MYWISHWKDANIVFFLSVVFVKWQSFPQSELQQVELDKFVRNHSPNESKLKNNLKKFGTNQTKVISPGQKSCITRKNSLSRFLLTRLAKVLWDEKKLFGEILQKQTSFSFCCHVFPSSEANQGIFANIVTLNCFLSLVCLLITLWINPK